MIDFAWYSVALIASFAGARWFTENIKFHLRNKRFWLHHWFLAFITMGVLVAADVQQAWIWGALTGVALEGLRRDQWSLLRKK
ncbi:MAG: hypothetical protein QF880_02035 [Candidatus Poseidonia sp.]|jgi:hypothetical protein|nr:hypothetical protein [Poseidonia sp.]